MYISPARHPQTERDSLFSHKTMNPLTEAELLSNRRENLAFADMLLQRCMRKAAGFRSDLTIETVAQNSTLVVRAGDGLFRIVVHALDERVDYWGVSHQNPDTKVADHFYADNRCTLQRKLRRCARSVLTPDKPPGPGPTPEFEHNLVVLRSLLGTYSVSPQDARIYPSSLDNAWIYHRTTSRRRQDHQLIVGKIALERHIGALHKSKARAVHTVRVAVPTPGHTAYYLLVSIDTASRKRKRNGAVTVTVTSL
jgi:hypothetical protein